MLKDHIWPLWTFVPFELKQSTNEGKNIDLCKAKISRLEEMPAGDPEKEALAGELIDELAALPARESFPYVEPSGLEEIRSKRPGQGGMLENDTARLSDGTLYDKVYGAWLGRCAGCLLGQPVEFWPRERFIGLLRDTGNYPVKYYISSDIGEELRSRYKVTDTGWNYGSSVTNWINNVKYMPEDDDINYVILALKTVMQAGPGFTSDDIGGQWIMDLPLLHTFTAERIAYRNILNGIFPPYSASFRNPCREWIGAQIRGDFFGYINPGAPELAAEMAWRDASVSHVKNGIYGEMFVAAMLASAFLTSDAEEIIRYGLSQVPKESRFTEAVNSVVAWKKQGLDWEQAIEKIHSRYDEKDEFDSLDVLPNAMVVCTGLIYGGMDFEKSVGIALAGSFDKDCNCATVGSVVGMVLGADKLPGKWIKPLNDTVKSGVDGFGLVSISGLAEKTVEVLKSNKY